MKFKCLSKIALKSCARTTEIRRSFHIEQGEQAGKKGRVEVELVPNFFKSGLTERIRFPVIFREAIDDLEIKGRELSAELKEMNESSRPEVTEETRAEQSRVALLRKIIKTQEDERKRIARDIHDHIGQEMTGLQLKLHLILEQYKENSEITAKLVELQSIANKIDSEIDFLAWELRPSVLDNLGLTAAIEQYVDEWSLHFNISAEFDCIGLRENKLTPEIEINLYRIGQEALNNIAKHVKAKNVAVLLERRDGEVVFIIEDDGVGFEPSKAAIFTGNDRGMGLLGMKERAELVGGTFHIESSNEAGTTVYARVPTLFSGEEVV